MIDEDLKFNTEEDELQWARMITIECGLDNKTTHVVRYYTTEDDREYYLFEYIDVENNGSIVNNFNGYHWLEMIKIIDFSDTCFIYSQDVHKKDHYRLISRGNFIKKHIIEDVEDIEEYKEIVNYDDIFYQISNKFRCKEHSLNTFASLVEEIRHNIGNLNQTQVQGSLDNVVYVLENSRLKEPTLWSKKNSEHFSGNIIIKSDKDNFLIKLKDKFDSGKYELDDIKKLTVFVRDYYDRLVKQRGNQVELLLRNVEVTLREDIEVNNEIDFYDNGVKFACDIEDSLEMGSNY